tara:strand:- start:123 stop:317 length:195 start_codon:yes stop_codon:yes gene_type:complete
MALRAAFYAGRSKPGWYDVLMWSNPACESPTAAPEKCETFFRQDSAPSKADVMIGSATHQDSFK